MSIDTSPPSAQVSMSDLMALPPQQLAAMANNQQPSIAPPWMITSALNAVNQMKAGQQQPQQQNTIKNQVVQKAMAQQHPMAQGIGTIPAPVPGQQQLPPSQPLAPQGPPPQQNMAAGGAVRHFDSGGSTNPIFGAYDYLTNLAANADANMKASVRGGSPSQYMSAPTPASSIYDSVAGYLNGIGNTVSGWDASMKAAVRGTTPTATPTAMTAAPATATNATNFVGKVPAIAAQGIPTTPNGAVIPTTPAQIAQADADIHAWAEAHRLPGSASAAAPGVAPATYPGAAGGMGSRMSAYLGMPVGTPSNNAIVPALGSTPDLTPPTPTNLNAALAYYQDPNGAAAQSVRGAGLAAYAAQMNPTHLSVGDITGFGGRSAASDAAQFAAAQARSDYIQGKAEQLGMTADQLAQTQYNANITNQTEQQKLQLQAQQYNNGQANQTYKTQLDAGVQAEHNAVLEQSNQLLMQMREDQNTLGFATLYATKTAQVDQESQAYADAVVKQNQLGGLTDPVAQQNMWRNAYNSHHAMGLQALYASFAPLVSAARASGNPNRAAAAGYGLPTTGGAVLTGIGSYTGVTGLGGNNSAGVLKVPGYN